MAAGPARTAEELSDEMESFMARFAKSDVPDEVAERGRQLASLVGNVADEIVDKAGDAWRDSAPARQGMRRAVRRTWRDDLRPIIRTFGRRVLAFGAAGAAIPAGRQFAEDAAIQLGIRQREDRHWGVFFLGLLVGAAAGVLAAILTAPKPGRQTRKELVVRARDVAADVEEWMPLRPHQEGNGGSASPSAEAEVESES